MEKFLAVVFLLVFIGFFFLTFADELFQYSGQYSGLVASFPLIFLAFATAVPIAIALRRRV